jgi:protein-S-isoprenylcysteine O-methyltransferase Ste14
MIVYPLIVLLVVLVYGLVHSLLASLWFKNLIYRWMGLSTDRWYRLVFNLLAGLTFLPVVAFPALLPDQSLYAIHFPWVLLSSMGQLLAVYALVIGIRQTGLWQFLGLRQLVISNKVDPPEFVAGGLYRYVRHPLYTAGLVFIWLTPLMTVNILALNLGLSVYLIIGAKFEERKLEREFGEVYLSYRKETPMLIPALWRRH